MTESTEKQNSYPNISECSYRELQVHVLAELVRLYAEAGETVDADVLARVSKLGDIACLFDG